MCRPAVPPRGIDDGKIESLIARLHGHEQVEDFIDHCIGPGLLAVAFVDHHDERQVEFEGLAQYEPGLGHGAFKRIHQQQNPIRHFQHPLDLAAEVGMARSVDDVDAEGLSRAIAFLGPI